MTARPGSRLGVGRVALVALIGLGGAAVLFPQAPLAGQAPAPGQPATAPRVTFAKDIAPILQRSCQNCHRPNSLAPMSLLTYEQVRPYAAAIKRRTSIRSKQGTMPPWYIEKGIGIQHTRGGEIAAEADETRHIRYRAQLEHGAEADRDGGVAPALVTCPRGRRSHRPVGGQRCAAWKSGRPAGAAEVRRRQRMDDRHAGYRRQDAGRQRQGGAARLVGSGWFCRHRAHRGSLRVRD